jgi:hypothetical protein
MQRRGTIGSFTYYLESRRFFQDVPQADAHQRVIIGDQYANHLFSYFTFCPADGNAKLPNAAIRDIVPSDARLQPHPLRAKDSGRKACNVVLGCDTDTTFVSDLGGDSMASTEMCCEKLSIRSLALVKSAAFLVFTIGASVCEPI